MKNKIFILSILLSFNYSIAASDFFNNVSILVGPAYGSSKELKEYKSYKEYIPTNYKDYKVNQKKIEPNINTNNIKANIDVITTDNKVKEERNHDMEAIDFRPDIIDTTKYQYVIEDNPKILKNITIMQRVPYDKQNIEIIDTDRTYLAKKIIGIDSENYDAKINNAFLGEINPMVYDYIKNMISKVETKVNKNRKLITELKQLLLSKYQELSTKINYKNNEIDKLIKNYISLISTIEKQMVNLTTMYKMNVINYKELNVKLSFLDKELTALKEKIYSTVLIDKKLKKAYNMAKNKVFLEISKEAYKEEIEQRINNNSNNNKQGINIQNLNLNLNNQINNNNNKINIEKNIKNKKKFKPVNINIFN